jgi:transposase InsO family protein
MLHVDLCGPISVQSLGRKKYILVLIDEFKRFTWVEFIRKKSQVPSVLINLLKRLQVLHGFQVRVLRSDNGTEFKNTAIEEYLASVGITQNFSAPRTPQQNGVVERKNRTLVEAARTMLNASGLPLSFWAEAVSTACYTQNRSLVVKNFEKTPYQLLHNKRPNIKFFHVFGCKCFVLNDREPLGKFDPKGDEAIFIGYAWDTAAFRIYVPRTQTVVVSTNVRFDDNFQVIQDKFTEELKTQADKSPNATIPQELEQLFTEWYDDEEPTRLSVELDRASDTQDQAEVASPSTTTISGPSSQIPSPSVTPPIISSSQEGTLTDSTTNLSSIQVPISTEPSSSTQIIHSNPVPPQVSASEAKSHTLQEINSTISLPHHKMDQRSSTIPNHW